MNVYIDESGDSGWTLDKERSKGGSTKYYVYLFLFIPKEKRTFSKRRVQNFYKKFNVKKSFELKGSELYPHCREWFCQSVVEMLGNNTDISLKAVILEKKTTPIIIREDSFDILCNHMTHLGVTDKMLTKSETINVVPDRKTTKKEREFSISDNLKLRSWFDNKTYHLINYGPEDSSKNYNLIFIDWIANTVWRHFELNDSSSFNILKPHLEVINMEF